MGTDRGKDRLLFRQFTKEENAKLATTWGPFASLSRDGRWLVLGYWIDTKSNDLWLVDFDRFLATGRIDKTVVTVGADGQATGTVIDGTLFIQTTKGAPRGRIVAASASQPGQAQWRDIVPERPDAIIETVSFGKGVIAVTYLKNAANVVEVFDFKGTSLGVVSQPGIGAAAVTAEIDRTEAYLTFTSFNYPTTIFRVDLATPQAAPELWERPDVPVDPAIAEVEQVWYPSKDGTRISMFLVHKKGLTTQRRHADAAHRLRRLQHQRDAGVFGDAVSMVRGRRPVRRCPTCAAAASTATPGTRPACSARSRTSSTISSPRPSG